MNHLSPSCYEVVTGKQWDWCMATVLQTNKPTIFSSAGHVFPGTIFIFWGSHWLLGFIRHYFECLKHAQTYNSKVSYRFLWLPERWPLESCVKLVLPGINMLLEVCQVYVEILSWCIYKHNIIWLIVITILPVCKYNFPRRDTALPALLHYVSQ